MEFVFQTTVTSSNKNRVFGLERSDFFYGDIEKIIYHVVRRHVKVQTFRGKKLPSASLFCYFMYFNRKDGSIVFPNVDKYLAD
jgi:hypothetical protein